MIEKLQEIEKNNEIKILYAIESGSRGWGFESKDSDYDVRFIYIHKPEWYLSIQDRRDVIELPIDSLLDINGWDIRKSLVLYKKSNPTLLEWLSSPIIYKQETTFVDQLKALLGQYFYSKTCIYHYLHMAQGNYREYLKGDMVRIKKYFYVLRPIMACMWVERYGTQPPMLFEQLLDSLQLDKELRKEIDKLLIRKKAGKEMNEEKQIKIINEFLEAKIEYFSIYVKSLNIRSTSNIEELDQLFRNILKEAWG
ncbi:nucleotidyltransferase domain-containing protein [Alkaliphilus crotonatoxidans]